MTVSTHFLQDILRQRAEMPRTINYLVGTGQQSLQDASFDEHGLLHTRAEATPIAD